MEGAGLDGFGGSTLEMVMEMCVLFWCGMEVMMVVVMVMLWLNQGE